MEIQNRFQRYEQKYLIQRQQFHQVLEAIKDHTIADAYGKSTICNIYFDTSDFRLIRRSMEKPIYKEKLRLRSYGIPKDNSTVFLELKKKYRSVVYKRREHMTYQQAIQFLQNPQPYSQITREISYFTEFYGELRPAMYLSYNREAFFGKDNPQLRITFDTDILWRNTHVNLQAGIYGSPILPSDSVLMEIKTDTAFPLWLTELLTREKIFQTSFSKYGKAYEIMQTIQTKGEFQYA